MTRAISVAFGAAVAWVRRFFPWRASKPEIAAPALLAVPQEPVPEPAILRVLPVKVPRIERPANSGAYVYLDDCLDQIGVCRKLLRWMKNVNREAYHYHRTMGARIVPNSMLASPTGLGPRFVRQLPSRAMIFVWDGAKKSPGAFCHFNRLDSTEGPHVIHYVLPRGVRALYRVDETWVARKTGKPSGFSFSVAITANGEAQVISERNVETCKPGFQRIEWGISGGLRLFHNYMIREVREGRSDGSLLGRTPAETGLLSFHWMANAYEMAAADDYRVRAERDGLSVVFTVAQGRTPYFFRARDRQALCADGTRRKIFHHVTEHNRVTPKGKTVVVKAHYRGERKFTWKGERIVVTPPENSDWEVNIAAQEIEPEASIPAGYVSSRAAGSQLNEVVEREWRSSRLQR